MRLRNWKTLIWKYGGQNCWNYGSSGAKATCRHCKCSSEGTLILLPALLSQGLLKTKDF